MELFDFTAFPVLNTPRLTLRQLLPSDAEAVFQIRGDYEVTKYNTGKAYATVQEASDLISAIESAYQAQNEIRWGITRKGHSLVIGMCGYNYWVRHDRRGSVGYDLARAHWGQGIMSEAVRAVVEFGFNHMGLNRIEADADARNVASTRVLEKIGFQREGLQREQFYEVGAFHDLVLFGLLKRDYLKGSL
ncbi:MAG: GNAT family N-acetyltransferase [Anaerolineae bacterium]|nr:GNAT family N-acetyltransferase [Anaerolineae bacterium]